MLKTVTFAIAATALIALAGAAAAQTAVPPTPPTQGATVTPIPTPTKSGYAPVNGVSVYYAVYGKGDPIVLLHGGFASIETFGPVIGLLAQGHQVIGVDLQGHGRTLPFDRPMSFEAMAEDVAALIRYLGFQKADVMGHSMGGGVALRVAIQHPDVVDRLVLVSTPYAFSGWHDYNQNGMRAIGPQIAENLKQTPLYRDYVSVAPDAGNWTKLVTQIGAFLGKDYDYSAEVKKITAPTMLVIGDSDAVRPSHIVKFYELLGGGLVDAEWDGSKMVKHRLAILPGQTHYTIAASPLLAATVIGFLDAPSPTAE